MILAIHFNDELDGKADKVDGVWANRMFAAEFQATHPRSADKLPDVLSEFVGMLTLDPREGDAV